MTGRVTTAEGTVYELPVLLEWTLRRTGGVPCDSFTVKCLYSAEMAEILKRANRFTALDGDGSTALCGVVDEWKAACSEAGRVLTITGRGMAALLLDNEAEAATYQCATLGEIVREQAGACGVRCASIREARYMGGYTVSSGSSRWKAIEGFVRRCGLRPYFSPAGELSFRAGTEGERHMLGETAVLEASYRDKRYGVLSQAVVVNRSKGLRQTVRNEAFLSRGGKCERVVYVPSRSVNELRYAGSYQIEKSEEGAREVRVLFAGNAAVEPEDRVELHLGMLGIEGVLRVSEVTRRLTERGETTELTLWEE